MAILAWRIAKYLGFALFAAGLFDAVRLPQADERQKAVAQRVVPGFVLLCIGGYGLMKTLGYGLGDAWIFRSFVAGAAAVSGAVASAEGGWSRRPGAAAALGALGAAIGLMVTRNNPEAVALIAAPTLVGAACGFALSPATSGAPSAHRALAWFRTIAWLEGASLILMVCIAMPLRKLAGIHLDGGQGWIGWMHGILVVLYLPALASAMWSAPLSVPKAVLGFIASVVPGGTFAFERFALPRE